MQLSFQGGSIMKKWWVIIGISLLLTGCSVRETFETVEDEIVQPVMAEVGEISLALPPEASAQTILANGEDKLYFCDGYTAAVQILSRGNLDRTCRQLCGFGMESLNILQTTSGAHKRYDWVWTAAGEGGDQMGRTAVIDDGKYHYCVSLVADADRAGNLENSWSKLLASFCVD